MPQCGRLYIRTSHASSLPTTSIRGLKLMAPCSPGKMPDGQSSRFLVLYSRAMQAAMHRANRFNHMQRCANQYVQTSLGSLGFLRTLQVPQRRCQASTRQGCSHELLLTTAGGIFMFEDLQILWNVVDQSLLGKPSF